LPIVHKQDKAVLLGTFAIAQRNKEGIEGQDRSEPVVDGLEDGLGIRPASAGERNVTQQHRLLLLPPQLSLKLFDLAFQLNHKAPQDQSSRTYTRNQTITFSGLA
jgi:hypothetical protein